MHTSLPFEAKERICEGHKAMLVGHTIMKYINITFIHTFIL